MSRTKLRDDFIGSWSYLLRVSDSEFAFEESICPEACPVPSQMIEERSKPG